MNKTQVEDLAALQRAIYDQVEKMDQNKLMQQMEVMLYWIRRRIWREVLIVMTECGDLENAARLDIADIQLQSKAVASFLRSQAALIVAANSGEHEGRECWLHFVEWVGVVVEGEVSIRRNKYIKVETKRRR